MTYVSPPDGLAPGHLGDSVRAAYRRYPAYRFRSYAFVRSTDVPVQTVQYVDRLRKIGTRHSRHPTLTEWGW